MQCNKLLIFYLTLKKVEKIRSQPEQDGALLEMLRKKMLKYLPATLHYRTTQRQSILHLRHSDVQIAL